EIASVRRSSALSRQRYPGSGRPGCGCPGCGVRAAVSGRRCPATGTAPARIACHTHLRVL
ncbi:MAG TPA: hypothetical protein VFC16_00845, partial [Nakamurella sp.]|nr:hypothetical protein [Nakamurella sp.]